MRLFDVDALIIVDFKGDILLKKLYNIKEEKVQSIVKKCTLENDPMFIHDSNLVLCNKENEITTILISYADNNEVFLGYSFDQFNQALKQTLKKCTKEALQKKYDVVMLIMDIFVYQGIICENKSEKILEMLPRRSFESTEGMKIPKGFASVMYNASKSFSRYM